MKRILQYASIASAILILAQCSPKTHKATNTSTTPSTANVLDEIKAKYTAADLASGKAIFDDKCDDCHKLKQPPTLTITKWEKVLPPMSRKAKLSNVDAEKVRAYVLTNAKAG